MSRRLHLLTLPLLLAAAACEQKIDSPKLSLSDVTPKVVCDQQLTTTLTLTGDGMTPLPIRTLGGTGGQNQPQSIQLPEIDLVITSDLSEMMMMMGSPVPVPDSPDAPSTSHVKWASEQKMSFDIFPMIAAGGMPLADGVYEIDVLNPECIGITPPAMCDPMSKTSLPHAIAAVPPPKLLSVTPSGICVAQMDQTVTIAGTNFLVIGMTKPTVTFTAMGGMPTKTYTPTKMTGCKPIAPSVMSDLQECTGMELLIKQNDLTPGNYTVVVTNPAPANCHSSESVIIKVSPPPKVTDVTPKTICQGGGTLDVKGMDFQDMAKVSLGSQMAGNVKFIATTELQATFGGGNVMFTPGMKYDLTVTNPDGCHDTLKDAVTAVAGPVLFFVDPPVVFNGITTQVTMYSTSITPPLVSVVATPSGGGMAIMLTAMIDPNHPKRILAIIPKGTPAGDYDITVTDSSGCPATLPKGLKVVDMATVMLTAITPPFGFKDGTTDVTITSQGGLVATPRAYLSPHNAGMGTVATALGSVAFVDANKITAIVPKGIDPAANKYDLIVVNPDNTVGVLQDAYSSTALDTPVIDGISPGSLAVPAGGTLIISGNNFRMPSVTITCQNTQPFTVMPQASTLTSITLNLAVPPFTAVVSPNFCLIRVTDGDDMSYADFSALAVSGSSGNLSAPKAGTDLPEARRALSLVGANATRAARFLYAIGGDNGMTAMPFDTVVTTTSDEKGTGAAWFKQRYALNKPRTLAAAASLGRYIYVVGGNDGTGPVKTAERAIVLDPLQAPEVTDIDIVPGGGMGLGGGIWYYRVAAKMDPNDGDNPDGETLPSDEVTLQIPDIMQKIQITLTWKQVPGAAGYVIYRSKDAGMISGQEETLDTVLGGNVLTYTDKGKMTMGGSALVQGSTGTWRKLPDMNFNRESVGVAFGTDPSDGTKHYLYATLGKDQAALGSYEFLPVAVGMNGVQTIANSWSNGAQTTMPAYQHSVFSADHAIASFVPAGTNYIYVGGGTANGNQAVQFLAAGKVTAGGDLGAFVASGTSIKSFGHGYTIAANYLYGFCNETPSQSIFAGQIVMGGAPAVANYNNNGGGTLVARYLPGTTLQGALMYLAGGSNVGRTSATKAVEWMVW